VLCAQEEDPADNYYKPQSYIGITWSPSALLNIHPAIQFGIERKWKDGNAWEFEAAWIFPAEVKDRVRNSGHRQKLIYKIASPRRYSYNFMLYHRVINTSTTGDYLINGDYLQQFNRHVTRRSINPAFGPSTHFHLSKRILGEFGILVGAGVIYVSEQNDAPEGSVLNTGLFNRQVFRNAGTYLYPLMSFNLKFKYVFHRTHTDPRTRRRK